MTDIVNTTKATYQEEVTNKLDISTWSYTTPDSATSSTTSATVKKEPDSSFVFPSIGSSVLDSLPPVLEAGPWIEKPPIPSWDDLRDDNIDNAEQEINLETEDNKNGGKIVAVGGWSDVFEWSESEKPKEVYEIELEQTIPGAGARVSGSVLRPGLVIDDPDLIQSIVSTNDKTQGEEEPDTASRSEESEFEEGFADPLLLELPSFAGSLEEVPIIEYSEFYPAVVNYDDAQDIVYSEYSNLVEPESESSSSSEPEIHCDLSILLSGISCTFKILDDEAKIQPPLIASSDLAPEPESAIFEVSPPQLPWSTVQESLNVNEDLAGSKWQKTDQNVAVNTLVQKLNVIDDKADTNEINVGIEVESNAENTSMHLNTSLKDEMKGTYQKVVREKISSMNSLEPDKEVRHVVHHLEDLEKDTELLQIIIDQLQLLDNSGNTNISINGQNIGSSSELLESTSNRTPDETTAISLVSKPSNETILPASALDKPKEKVCGVKGGQYVQNAYGKSASKYILPLLIDSWVFGKDKRQKAR